MNEGFHTLIAFHRWANRELISSLQLQQTQLPKESEQLARRLLQHIWVVEQIFRGNLLGHPHGFTTLNLPATPELSLMAQRLEESADWLQSYLSTLSPAVWQSPRTFVFVDGQPGCMSAEQMMWHLILHGAHHRGMICRMLAEAELKPPKEVLTVFLHQE